MPSNVSGSLAAHKDAFAKTRFSLIDLDFVEEMARAMESGLTKYEPHDWLKGAEWSKYFDAALRHLKAWNVGQERDLESGCSPLAHAACCLMILSAYQKRSLGADDRIVRKAEKVTRLLRKAEEAWE